MNKINNVARWGHKYVEIDNKIYIHGGCNNQLKQLNSIE